MSGILTTEEQWEYEGLPVLPDVELAARREKVFLLLAAVFLGALAVLNVIGVTKFIDLGFQVMDLPVMVAVGVLPYPVTFLCTDLICELYGQRRANWLVLAGLVVNVFAFSILWVGGILPGAEGPGETFSEVRTIALGGIVASMIAYLVAQFLDVRLFHFWKRLTKGRHLWLRNNASTLVSQLVDTVAVILITHFYASSLPIEESQSIWPQLIAFIVAGYTFKVVAALVDTLPFYWLSRQLRRYLRISPPFTDENASLI